MTYGHAAACLDDNAGPGTCWDFWGDSEGDEKKRRSLLEDDSEDSEEACRVTPLYEQCR
jgi:hypothetical protein